MLLEAAERVGGRVRTDVIDGFRCDRGFQLLNPAYPAVRRWVDVEALALQRFSPGVLVRASEGFRVLADPVRAPEFALDTLRSGLLQPIEVARLAAWLAPFLLNPQRAARADDASVTDSLDAAGVTGRARRVLDRFIAGVVADSRGATSANFVRLLLRSFVHGTPGLPRAGMQALPAQLAAGVDDLRLATPARAVTPTTTDAPATVDTDSGRLSAQVVVVATDPDSASALTGLPEVAMKGLVTWWFTAPQAPDERALLVVDGRHGPDGGPPGPVWNAAVVSAAAPSYAPEGRVLIQATTLLDRADGDCDEADVRRHLGDLYSCDVSGWEVITRHRLPQALPACPPPLQLTRPVQAASGVIVCGDHRDTGSIQGALVSGERAARRVLAQ